MVRKIIPVLLCVCPLVLAACSDWAEKEPSRNFDELIPRFMGAANKATPEDAAQNLFNVTSPDERRDAIAYLQVKPYGHQPPYMRAYEMLTTDPYPLVRAQAMRALGSSSQASAVPLLIKGLNDREAVVRRDASAGLMSTFAPEAVPALTDHVRADVDDQVRINCARALARANTPEAVRSLIDAMEDKDAGVVYCARQSLVTSTQQDQGYDTRAWLTWYRETYSAPATGPATAPGNVAQ